MLHGSTGWIDSDTGEPVEVFEGKLGFCRGFY